ncbi:MAG: pyridoxine 5'-phosphate synthase [Deltaproteobacteria bacterium]|nr:MAG: pyridoxine 5'-phosphate synthase [Deltaproteobacteria bacterium]
MKKLGVNIDHVATVREARKTVEPDPVYAAVLAELAGADGITVHLREDRRHIKDRDVRLLKQFIKTKLNLEMAATDEMVGIATEVKPYSSTIVPERREEVTTEGGLDVVGSYERIKDVVSSLKSAGIVVSLFVDPDLEQIEASRRAGADYIEIHTGRYCEAFGGEKEKEELEAIRRAAFFASSIGLGVNAGHGLNYKNIIPVLEIPQIEEFNIGHSIVSRAVFVGLYEAVREMVLLIRGKA